MNPITALNDAKETLEGLAKTISASRLTRDELMLTLSKIYAIRLSENDRQELMKFVIEQRKLEGCNRAYLFKAQNHPFMLPVRYVFPSSRDRSNVSRYAGALRELNRLNVPPEKFADEVKARGGIIELYWNGRGRETKKQMRSKLTLDRNIEVVSGQPITLHLMPTASGIFKVIELVKEAA